MTKEEFAYKFVQAFPEYSKGLVEHMDEYGELLGHVFFGDCINSHLVDLLGKNKDLTRIRAMFDFINNMYRSGDEDCKNIVEVTILEYIGDDKNILERAFEYLTDELKEASNEVEISWGRR